MEARMFTLKTRSGLHCGIGQGLSDIDLPTAKEAVSGYPLVPGSSLKGVLRDRFEPNNGDKDNKFLAAFGQEAEKGESGLDYASALSFTDARLICLPVRSYFGTFAYLASPYSLNILKEIARQGNKHSLPELPSYPKPTDTDSYRASIPENSKLVSFSRLAGKVLLEDLDLLVDSESSDIADKWGRYLAVLLYQGDDEGQNLFIEHFAIVDDNVLAFLCETALPVAAHNRIGENGIVEQWALWYEEYVPPEAVFAGVVYGEDGKGKHSELKSSVLLDYVCGGPLDIQVGGSATTGRGLVSIRFTR